MASIAGMVTHGTVDHYLDGGGNPRVRRVMSTADMASTFHADSALEHYTSQPKIADVPIGTPINVAPDSVVANGARSSILGNAEAALALVHILVTDDPRTGDPPVPAPGQGCESETDNPHWSNGAQTVLAKGWLKCTYTGVAIASMYMWHCTAPPGQSQFLLDLGSWGCQRVAQNLEEIVPVTAGEWTTIPIFVPKEEKVDASTGYWIASLSGPNIEESYSQEDWGYNNAGEWTYLP